MTLVPIRDPRRVQLLIMILVPATARLMTTRANTRTLSHTHTQLFIMILVPAREYFLIKFFSKEHLAELDPLDLSDPDHANDWDVHHNHDVALSARPAQSHMPGAINGAPLPTQQPGFVPVMYSMPPQMVPAHMQGMHPIGGMPMVYPGFNSHMQQHAFA